ncbi:hypothetical protein ACFY5D_02955 [Paeniglutamicibacter sp. NPDC012692]|uniref:hypothetical protein n=1 Tax=Paeniglutamicibacter sp. NPDC012692 TaxID=3364388 RepID=UPI00367D9D6E
MNIKSTSSATAAAISSKYPLPPSKNGIEALVRRHVPTIAPAQALERESTPFLT